MSKNRILDSSKIWSNSWKRMRILESLLLGQLIFVALGPFLSKHLSGEQLRVATIGWILCGAVVSNFLAASRCPRCDEGFFCSGRCVGQWVCFGGFTNIFRKNCIHCNLPKRSAYLGVESSKYKNVFQRIDQSKKVE